MRRKTILIVDDERDIRTGLSMLLNRGGYAVLAARSGEDAIELLKDAPPPDLMVLDFMLPKMNGFQTMDRIRALGAGEFPIIMLTANTSLNSDEFGYGRGVDLYLSKPFDPGMLMRAVRYFTHNGRKAEREEMLVNQSPMSAASPALAAQ